MTSRGRARDPRRDRRLPRGAHRQSLYIRDLPRAARHRGDARRVGVLLQRAARGAPRITPATTSTTSGSGSVRLSQPDVASRLPARARSRAQAGSPRWNSGALPFDPVGVVCAQSGRAGCPSRPSARIDKLRAMLLAPSASRSSSPRHSPPPPSPRTPILVSRSSCPRSRPTDSRPPSPRSPGSAPVTRCRARTTPVAASVRRRNGFTTNSARRVHASRSASTTTRFRRRATASCATSASAISSRCCPGARRGASM